MGPSFVHEEAKKAHIKPNRMSLKVDEHFIIR
jgi:hypothetical protein